MFDRGFVDEAKFTVRAGDGGDGCTSFESQAYKPRGGPDGGNGGDGGDVVLRANEGLSTLSELTYHDLIEAEDGSHGGSKGQRGSDGEDEIIEVPPGTAVYHRETDEKIGELNDDGDTLLVAHGGEGGRGNRSFVSSQRQAPRFHEMGSAGEEIPLRLELKLLAEVGLVGAPNAGKSTLLSRLTAAHPEIAEHPFTTQSPNLGALFKDHEQLTICDIPGLIENAHQGAGLGLDFLRHVERTRILLHVVDVSGTHPLDEYEAVRAEMQAYKPELLEKPYVLVLNKIDRADWDVIELVQQELDPEGPTVLVSALEGTGLRTLEEIIWSTWRLIETLDRLEQTDETEHDRVVTMEQEQPITVQKLGDRYILHGDRIEELVNRFDLSNQEAQSYVREQLLSEGLHKKLQAAGCEPGDTIQVNDQVFNYTG